MLPLLMMFACSPQEQPYVVVPGGKPYLDGGVFYTSDGTKLPVRLWRPEGKPKAIIVALHGFNDYSHAFESTGGFFSARGIAVYAYDQRGFGRAPHTGIWAGKENITQDLKQFVRTLKGLYPDAPLYILGESMGGAVAISAAAKNVAIPKEEDAGWEQLLENISPAMPPPVSPPLGEGEIKGIILVAPALWGVDSLNPLYRGTLWVMAHMVPDYTMTGEDLKILASNNIPMLRAMGEDPLIIKATRTDAVYGLVSLMDEAYEGIPGLEVPLLLLYGGCDEVIPRSPIMDSVDRLNARSRYLYYPEGYHMLLRDLQGAMVMGDIAQWIEHPKKSVPDLRWRLPEEALKETSPAKCRELLHAKKSP